MTTVVQDNIKVTTERIRDGSGDILKLNACVTSIPQSCDVYSTLSRPTQTSHAILKISQ